ncbi:MAG: HupE/UreJ family protein [Betaproteobacteria bacterium]|nr:HupE/UreJ family protein [Betaproteobacteria bacterium]
MTAAQLLLGLVLASAPLGQAQAHKPSDSYLALRIDGAHVAGQWDIAVRDLEAAIGLDSDGDGEVTWGELKSRHADIAAYALARLALQADAGPCTLRAAEHLLDHHSDGAYAVLRFQADCGGTGDALEIRYSLFFDFDAQHKGLLRLEAQGQTHTAAFAADRATQRFELRRASVLEQFLSFTREGVWHIWIGVDHILFIVSLLLPAVLTFGYRRWQPAPRFAPAFWDTFKVVTAFTVAHSVTLSLAALGVISLPSRLVESAIAASVALAAANNLLPLVRAGRWLVAFVFGLIHGFGFASVLADLGLPKESLLVALVSFNLGVEIGQLVIVSLFLPLAFALRATWLYQRLVMTGGSVAVVVIALIWLAERALNLKILNI